ncbi:hypothetical protein M9Y10_034226 [Tritrichomonas musculus]|uniref:Uncharacterized protein n=1 Tax=Tritrichomonas musculus TaxID=1915356 RepID=A0ABR2KEB2_9EUKA
MSSLPPLNKTSEKDQVIQHAEVPELNILLCGPNPEIYSARPSNQKKKFYISEPSESQTLQNPRFSTFDEASLNQTPQTTRSDHSTTNKQIQNARFFSKLREDEQFTQSMNSKLTDYQKTRRAKSLIQHEQYENHYYKPLQRRIKNQITSKNYNKYLTRKQQLINSMDRDPVPINSPRKLPPIATIKFSTEGLRDPKSKYIDRQKEEKKIVQLFQQANGEETREKKVPPHQTLDYDHIYVQQHTRFYFGNDPENGNKSGRKVFEGTGRSMVGNEINSFPQD